MQRRAATAYRLPVPLGTPPLLNVWRLEPVKLPRARVTPHTEPEQPFKYCNAQDFYLSVRFAGFPARSLSDAMLPWTNRRSSRETKAGKQSKAERGERANELDARRSEKMMLRALQKEARTQAAAGRRQDSARADEAARAAAAALSRPGQTDPSPPMPTNV